MARPRARILWLGLAAAAGGLLGASVAGCHLVVGADEYQIDPAGQGAAGATSSTGSGATTTSGSGGHGGAVTTSSSSGGATTSSSTSDAGGTTTTTTGAGGSPPIPCAQMPSCEECMGCAVLEDCEPQYTACMASPDCATISNCAIGCTYYGCAEACFAANPGGQAQAMALYYCLFMAVCAAPCS